MNNAPKTTGTEASFRNQNSPNSIGTRPAGPSPVRPTASAASEIGTQATQRGVRFSPHNNGQIQEQIRTYIPGTRVTPARIAQGDREGSVLAHQRGRDPLRELITTVSPARPTIVARGRFTTLLSGTRWETSSVRHRPQPTLDTAAHPPRRAADATPGMPTRRADIDD
jgi:hypothetical protein